MTADTSTFVASGRVLLPRLRRSVALFICPELHVSPIDVEAVAPPEPELHSRFMTAEEKFNLECRIYFAANPWREVLAWLKECQDRGVWRLPEDGNAFVGELVLLAATISGPAVRGRK
ncbi:hypothetical protein [Frigidibacter oleivorans]|uniref:hypothetical protein n=1 Tax=Frigidibacter oleivorans TaxID=2487129 RepID=UPI000F8CE09F|nr:hypothetical protein [Frigidibacter oleivorans]